MKKIENMKINEKNTSQRGGLSKGGDGGLKHTQNHICTVESSSLFVQQPRGYEKKTASADFFKKNRLSKSRLHFSEENRVRDFLH